MKNLRLKNLRLGVALSLAVGIVASIPSSVLAVGGTDQFDFGTALTDQNLDAELAYTTRMRQGFYGAYGASGNYVGGYDLSPDTASDAAGFFLVVHDGAGDGKRVGVHWRTRDGEQMGLCVNKQGKDYGGLGRGSGRWCHADVPEGKAIKFRIGVCDADVAPCGSADNWKSQLDNWTWMTLDASPWLTNGWRDYTDDANKSKSDDCSEIGTNPPDC